MQALSDIIKRGKAMRIYLLEREREIERSRRLTFALFDGAFNMERVTPPFLLFWVPNARLRATASGVAAPASRQAA